MTLDPNLLEQIVNEGPAVAYAWDLDSNWQVSYISESIEQFGYTAKDLMDGEVLFTDIIFKDDLDRVVGEFEQFQVSGVDRFFLNYRIVTRDGKVRTVADWSHIVRDEKGRATFSRGMLIDISEAVSTEQRARLYLDNSGAMFVQLDATGMILQVNQKTESIIGLPASALIGTSWIDQFIPEDELDGVRQAFARGFAWDESLGYLENENDILTANGERRRISWRFVPEKDLAGEVSYMVAFGRDVTDERATAERNRVLAEYQRLSPNLLIRLDRSGDIQYANDVSLKWIDQLAQCPKHQIDAWKAQIAITAGSTSAREFVQEIGDNFFLIKTVPSAAHINMYGVDITREREGQIRLSGIAKSLPGALLEVILHPDGTESITFWNDKCEELWGIDADSLKHNPARLWEMVHPQDVDELQASILKSRDGLSAWQYEWRIETPTGEKKWLQGSAAPRRQANGDTVWFNIVQDVTAFKAVTEQRSESLSKTVRALSAVLEARDPYTDGHEQRVASISVAIAKQLGFERQRIMGLELAAEIHDLGKISIPAEILSKPSKLSDLEFDLIKTHAAVGADFIKDIEFDWPIADMIRQHHERLDGSGYPNGLKGDEILLESRILSVADTLEAMFSHRPYRAGLGLQAAIDELQQGRGRIYDAAVVDAALHLIEARKLELTH